MKVEASKADLKNEGAKLLKCRDEFPLVTSIGQHAAYLLDAVEDNKAIHKVVQGSRFDSLCGKLWIFFFFTEGRG